MSPNREEIEAHILQMPEADAFGLLICKVAKTNRSVWASSLAMFSMIETMSAIIDHQQCMALAEAGRDMLDRIEHRVRPPMNVN